MNASGKKLLKGKNKQVRVLVCQNNFPLRIFTLAMPMLSSNQDDLLKDISRKIFSTDMILKDKENGFKLVFKDGTVRRVQMTTNNDPHYTCDYKISILPPSMFMCAEYEPERQKYELKDVDYDTMYDLLYFLYAGHFKDGAWLFTDEIFDKCAKLLEADSIYCVARLKEECEQKLMAALSTNNLIAIV